MTTQAHSSQPTKPAKPPKLPGLGRIARPADPPELVLCMAEAAGTEGSVLENRLLAQLRQAGAPEPIREYPFRSWRIDFVWPNVTPPLCVEIEGGVWLPGGGRHNRAEGYANDCRKYNAISLAGHTLLRFIERDIHNGRAAREVAAVLAARQGSLHARAC